AAATDVIASDRRDRRRLRLWTLPVMSPTLLACNGRERAPPARWDPSRVGRRRGPGSAAELQRPAGLVGVRIGAQLPGIDEAAVRRGRRVGADDVVAAERSGLHRELGGFDHPVGIGLDRKGRAEVAVAGPGLVALVGALVDAEVGGVLLVAR